MSATARRPKKVDILPYSPENYPAEIPEFATEEEARDFFDTHDMSYYWDQFEDVTDNPPPHLAQRDPSEPSTARRRPDPEPMELIQLRYPIGFVEALRDLARSKDLTCHQMVKSWIVERLEQERASLDRKS